MKCYNGCGDLTLFGRKIPLINIIPPEMVMHWDEHDDIVGDDINIYEAYLIGICSECGFVMTGTYKEERHPEEVVRDHLIEEQERENEELGSRVTMVHLEGVER